MAFATLASGCASAPTSRSTLPWSNAQQVVVVVTPDWNANQGALRTYERADGKWRQVGESEPVTVGRNGSAWGLGLHPDPKAGPLKREGDGRSPAGVFGIGDAFGYAQHADTALPYDAMQASHYCMDVSGSPLYNRIVDAQAVGAEAVAGSTEPMRLDLHSAGDQRYRLGFVIEHNPQARRGAGSCIFAHLWRKPAESTAGCTAMDDPTMTRLLAWLRPDQHPVFVLLPTDEYAGLRDAWQLPTLESTP
jgi:L,D-peptidoglycan transpeptidase YkuD (ErfK/YbiS/YcfS/YnhG family)